MRRYRHIIRAIGTEDAHYSNRVFLVGKPVDIHLMRLRKRRGSWYWYSGQAYVRERVKKAPVGYYFLQLAVNSRHSLCI